MAKPSGRQPLRVLVVTAACADPRQSASRAHVAQLIQLLLQSGCDVGYGYLSARSSASTDELQARAPGLRLYGLLPQTAVPAFDVLYLTDFWAAHTLRAAHALLLRLRAAGRRFVTVFDSMDCLHESLGGLLAPAGAAELLAQEQALRQAVDHCVVVSERERQLALQRFALEPSRVSVLALAFTLHEPGFARGFLQRTHLCFAGAAHPHNLRGLLWFLHRVMPSITAAQPQLECHILGSGMNDVPLALPATVAGHCKRVGFVADLDYAVSAFRVQVVPLHGGGGIKGKLLHSLACGTPIVTTTRGAEGMPVTDGVELRVAQSAEAFAAAVLELYRDEQQWHALQAAGRRLVETRYSWDCLRDQLRQLLAKLPVAH